MALPPELVVAALQLRLANESRLHHTAQVFLVELLLRLVVEVDKVGRHGSDVLLVADLLVQTHRVMLQVGLVVSDHVSVGRLLRALDLVPQSLQPKVRQVLPPIDPVPDGSLDLQDDGYKYLLDHLTVLHTLRVPEHLLDRRVNLGAARFDELDRLPVPALYLADICLEVGLIYLELYDGLVGSSVNIGPVGTLDLDGRFNLIPVHGSYKVLEAQDSANHNEVEDSPLPFVVLHMPKGLDYLFGKQRLQLIELFQVFATQLPLYAVDADTFRQFHVDGEPARFLSVTVLDE